MNKEDKALGLPRNEPLVPCYVCENDMTERSMNLCCQDCCDRMTELPSKEMFYKCEADKVLLRVRIAELERELAVHKRSEDWVTGKLTDWYSDMDEQDDGASREMIMCEEIFDELRTHVEGRKEG